MVDIAHALTTENWSAQFETLLARFAALGERDEAWVLRLMGHQIADAIDDLARSLEAGTLPWEEPWLESHLHPLGEEGRRRTAPPGRQLARIPKNLGELAQELDLLLQESEAALATPAPLEHAPRLRRFPHDLLALLTLLPEEELGALSSYLYQPAAAAAASPQASSGEERSEVDDAPRHNLPTPRAYHDVSHLAFQETLRLPGGEVEVHARFYPLMLDLQSRQIFYPTLVGIRPAEEEATPWPPSPPAIFWQQLQEEIQRLILAIYRGDVGEIERLTGSSAPRWRHFQAVPGLVAPRSLIRPPFYVAFGPAPQSDLARQIVNAAYPIQLPSQWSSLTHWEQIRRAEAERILRTEGEGDPRLRTVSRNDETSFDLTPDAERELKLKSSLRGGYIDADEFGREYLVRAFEVGSGSLEIGLSWHGLAGPFIHDWLEQSKARSKDERERLRFEELGEETQRKIDARMSQIRIWENGRRVMEMILGQIGRQRRNPIEIPAEAFRVLLWPSLARSRAWPRNWKRDVEGILEGLRAVTFRYQAHRTRDIKGRGMGSFIGEWSYVPRGKGKHGSGVYIIDVQRGFLGCLYVFISGRSRLRSGHEAFVFDFEKDLTPEERRALGWVYGSEPVDTYTLADASRPFVTAALEFTPQQENLLRWMDQEMTRRHDPARSGYTARRVISTHPQARSLREYGPDFCPLLPPGTLFAGALGHFSRSPESGFTLYGSRRQRRQKGQGLLALIGYRLPRGRAHARRREIVGRVLEDLKVVVEDHLDGVVVGRLNGRWLRLEAFTTLPLRDLLHELRIHLFVPVDYNHRLIEKWERATGYGAVIDAHEAERHYWRSPTGTPTMADGRAAADAAVDRPLNDRLYETMKRRGLKQKELAALFDVSSASISYWLRGPEPDEQGRVRGRPVPEEVVPLVVRWIEQNVPPTREELDALRSRRPGVRRRRASS